MSSSNPKHLLEARSPKVPMLERGIRHKNLGREENRASP